MSKKIKSMLTETAQLMWTNDFLPEDHEAFKVLARTIHANTPYDDVIQEIYDVEFVSDTVIRVFTGNYLVASGSTPKYDIPLKLIELQAKVMKTEQKIAKAKEEMKNFSIEKSNV